MTFASKDVGIDFNVFDFHGVKANYDWHLIKHLLKSMPQTCLLIVCDEEDAEEDENTYMRKLAEAFKGEEKLLEDKFLIINRC